MIKSLITMSFLLSKMALATGFEVSPAPVKHLYVPEGFDSNDAVEVIVTGHFPNPCYSRNDVKVQIRGEKVEIEVTALRPTHKMTCPNMIVPFKEVVSIGNLQGGDYQLNVNDKLHDSLTVHEADSSAIDEHLYAAIDQLELKDGDNYILHGVRYSSCLQLDRIEVKSNGKDTLSVLPIMKQVSSFCPMKGTPVSYPVKLNFNGLKSKEPLVHVRTMDGKSFNKVLDLNERR